MSANVSQSSSSSMNNESEVELSEHEMSLVRWEELALALEEHYHAKEMYLRRPDGPPMGHR